MLKTLIKKQLLELFQAYVKDRTGKTKSRKGVVATVVLLGVLYVIMSVSFFGMAFGIGLAVQGTEAEWLYFALVGLLATALGVIGSVFTTYASLYLPKDNELLFSLPIPPYKLLLARASGVFATGFIYTAWVWVPSVIAYWITSPLSVTRVIFPVISLFLVTLFVSVLTCILGFFVALIASKTKGKSFLTVIVSLLGFTLYYVVYFKLLNSVDSVLENIGELGTNVKKWLYFFCILGKGAGGEILPMLLFTGITLGLAAICLLVLSKTFTKLALSGKAESKKKKADRNFGQKTQRKALLSREYKHFTSSASWMLNGGLGLLLIPVGTVFLGIKRSTVLEFFEALEEEIPWLTRGVPVLLAVVICIILAMCAVTTTSVSIEGNTLWLIRSLPVDTREIIKAKERMFAEMAALPVMVCAAVCGFLLNVKIYEILLICTASMSFVLLTGDFGLMLDIKHPNLTWINESSVTKNSASVLINFFGGEGFCFAVGAVSFGISLLLGPVAALLLTTALHVGLWLLIRRWLRRKGAALLEAM